MCECLSAHMGVYMCVHVPRECVVHTQARSMHQIVRMWSQLVVSRCVCAGHQVSLEGVCSALWYRCVLVKDVYVL